MGGELLKTFEKCSLIGPFKNDCEIGRNDLESVKLVTCIQLASKLEAIWNVLV